MRRVLLAGAAAAAVTAGVVVAQAPQEGRIGPALGLLGNGRLLRPHGKQVRVGQFPTGGALTPDGRFYWAVSTGRGVNDVRIVSVRSRKVVQTLRLPGASGGIAMDPRHALAYVSGVSDSVGRADQETPPGTPGKAGDVVHVFSYDRRGGAATFRRVIPVPPPADAPAPQAFPPNPAGARVAWPDRLAISRDGRTLLVPLNLADAAAIVDVRSGGVRTVKTGTYPYGAAILPGGRTGLVSNEGPGTVSVVDLRRATKVKDIQVGPRLSHPEAIALDPKARRAYVAVANSDQVAVLDTRRLRVQRTLSVERPAGLGASPVDVAVTPNGHHLLVAEAGADALSVFALPRRGAHRPAAWRLLGRIPTAEYPTDVDASHGRLVWLSGKGMGTGPNPNGPQPSSPLDSDNAINSTQYLPLLNVGSVGIARYPSERAIRRLRRAADAQLRPSDPARAPAGTPLRANGPIRHVFYIVRENRTYDQILGDDARGDGDPKLALFGGDTTPNAHALARRFPLLDHVYANSEASIDGHFWTSAAKVSDYVHKNWFQNYGGRGRPYDFGLYTITWPSKGFLFDQAQRQGVSWFNYGEAVAGAVGLFPDKDRSAADLATENLKFSKSDLGPNGCYANDTSIGTDSITGVEVYDSSVPLGAKPGATSRFDCFRTRFAAQVAANAVPRFNYLVLTNDHTQTLTAGARTPRAMIADNDEALGRIVDLVSRSPIWSSSAIFVVEDDSQDGADHVDAHRIPAFVISPYARRGAIVHRRYDFLSFIRSMELILGLRPLGLADRLAVPMYAAFSGAPSNMEAYDAIPSKVDLVERNPGGTPGAAEAARLPAGLDQASQADAERLLWKSVHGWSSEPPPPGPNAENEAPRVLAH
jgi:DNA-binding beta-propeller fold protein YncE